MTGFTAFVVKELKEILRTWRIWVLPGIALFFAATSPAIAKFTPLMLESVLPAGVGFDVSKIPAPTYIDAYAQWIKNLSQIVMMAAIVSFGGIVSSEVTGGTAAMVLTKPVSRAAFVVAKAVSAAILLTGTVLAGGLVAWGFTAFVFGEAPLVALPETSLVWLVSAVFLTSVVILLSASVDSWAGASGGGMVVFFVMSALSLWPPAQRFSPVGLLAMMGDILAGRTVEWVGPALITAGLTVGLVALSAVVFSRREL